MLNELEINKGLISKEEVLDYYDKNIKLHDIRWNDLVQFINNKIYPYEDIIKLYPIRKTISELNNKNIQIIARYMRYLVKKYV